MQPEPRKRERQCNFPYIFVEHSDYPVQTSWRLKEPFEAEWLTIDCEGRVTVKANQNGYAWDGCTPKWSILNLFILGVPDGHVDYRTGKPFTYYASMVHDALYQYLDTIPVTKDQVDRLFLEMLGDFKLKQVYYLAVKWFGARGVVQYGLPSTASMAPPAGVP